MHRTYRVTYPVPALFLLFLILVSPGCLSSRQPDSNLTEDELAELYLAHSAAITDYRSEYLVNSGMGTENLNKERIRFDYKSPSFASFEIIESSWHSPGTCATTNGISTSWYDSGTRTYDLSSGMNLSREYDYQRIVRQVVADRDFAILERNMTGGTVRYLIEVETHPYSDRYTPYISSRVRASVDPYAGLAWKVTTYYDPGVVPGPTLAPGLMLPTPTPPVPDSITPGNISISEVPNREVIYESIHVNTGIPDSYFTFIPPEGSSPRCIPKYQNYVEPPRMEPSVPISEPYPGGVQYSLNESDSGRFISLNNGEILEITLRISPGLAYRWLMPTEGSGLSLINSGSYIEMPEDYDFNSSDTYFFFKRSGYYRWRFKAVEPGTTIFDGIFSLNGCDIQGAKRFNLTVQVGH